MSLAKGYCKELLRELNQLPVYLPGRSIQVGDIITYGSMGLFAEPLGDFQVVAALSDLGVDMQIRTDYNTGSYRFASKGSTSVSFTPDVHAGNASQGTLSIGFSKAGSVYLVGLECFREEMINTHTLESQLSAHRNSVDWNNCYIITSVTRAIRALIMQSKAPGAELVLHGETRELDPSYTGRIKPGLQFSITSHRDSAFIKEWSREAPLFLTLVRYKRNVLGDWKMGRRPTMTPRGSADIGDVHTIESVGKAEILEAEELSIEY